MMQCDLLRHLQYLWSPVLPLSRNDPRLTIESLLQPIRFSMAFLTLFSIISSIIIAIMLVPAKPLQLLAQFISLIVSLSGLFGTFRRSIMLSSIYALSMLLFLFLQCSYFFVLLKLVQEVNIGNNNSHHHHNNNSDKWPTPQLPTAVQFDQPAAYWTPLAGHATTDTVYRPEPSTIIANTNQYHHHQEPYSHYQTSSTSSVHVRHVTVMLNEELSYLSLLTVPMIAWLPPSLFMETVAVLILSMQALAAACFLYALHRTEAYRHINHRKDVNLYT